MGALTLLLGGCGSAPRQAALSTTPGAPDAVPRVEPKARYGNMASYVVYGKTYYPMQTSRGHVERGIASWYGPKFHGRKTSSGEPYNMYEMTAAHKTLPLPTYALVQNLENGRSAIVKVNDRGPFVGDRIIDLSYAAAKKLGVDRKGTARVEVVSIDPRDHGGKVPRVHRVAARQPRTEDRPERLQVRTASHSAENAPGHAPPPAAAAASAPRRAAESAPPAPRTPTALPIAAAAADSPLYLQVGAFGTRENAEQLRRQLTGLLRDPVQVRDPERAPTSGMPPSRPRLYKVQVGPITSRAHADDLSRRLASLGITRPLVIDN